MLHELVCRTAYLVYSFSKLRVYVLPAGGTELSRVFECLTDAAQMESLGIEQWGLSQTTLEEAFIRIVTTHS